MSSFGKYYSQCLTNQLVVSGTPATLFSESVIATATTSAAQTAGKIIQVASVSNLSTFYNQMSGTTLSSGEALIDLGATIHVGIQGIESDILTLRRVQRTNTSVNDMGNGSVGYVVVGNRISGDSTFGNLLPVRVGRV
jgi:hypothetical protein